MGKIISFFDNSECAFHQMTGLYCPGCGGTRAFYALLDGDLVRSLLYHPIVAYGYLCIVAVIFILVRSFTMKLHASKETFSSQIDLQTKATLERFVIHALLGAAFILLLHFILRNALTILGIPAFP